MELLLGLVILLVILYAAWWYCPKMKPEESFKDSDRVDSAVLDTIETKHDTVTHDYLSKLKAQHVTPELQQSHSQFTTRNNLLKGNTSFQYGVRDDPRHPTNYSGFFKPVKPTTNINSPGQMSEFSSDYPTDGGIFR